MILEKLNKLKSLDKRYSIFGSNNHKYILNPVLSSKELQKIEDKFHIILPSDYKEFLCTIGNGGAGKSYGMNRLSNLDKLNLAEPFAGVEKLLNKYVSNWWNSDREVLLAKFKPELENSFKTQIETTSTFQLFKKAEELNLETKSLSFYIYEFGIESDPLEDVNNVYVEVSHSEFKGFIPIFEEGCGHRYVLIVNGENYGELIMYGCDGQLSRTNKSFTEFYNDWLDSSINKLENIEADLKILPVEKVIENEWNSKNFSIRAMIYSIINIDTPPMKHNTNEYIPYLQSQVNKWKLKPTAKKESVKQKKKWWEKLINK